MSRYPVRLIAPDPRMVAIRGALLTPTPGGKIFYTRYGMVVADGQRGVIVYSGPESLDWWRKATARINTPGALIMAPFWDPHIHLPQKILAGRYREPLLEWLEHRVFPEEARHQQPAYAQAATEDFFETLDAVGTAGAGIFTAPFPHAAEAALEHAARRRVPVRVGPPLMDEGPGLFTRTPEQWEESLVSLRDRHRGSVAVVPRFALSCTPALLERAGRLAATTRSWVLGHISETRSEVEAVHRMYPADGDSAYTLLYDRHRLLGPRSILAHGVHLTRTELELLASRRAVIAHCPTANEALGSGRMPLERLRRAGVRWCLASDVGAGPDPNMLDVMRAFVRAHRGKAKATHSEAYYRASLAGAEALGFGRSRGALLPGRVADILVCAYRPRRPRGPEGVLRELMEWDEYNPPRLRNRRLVRAGRFDPEP